MVISIPTIYSQVKESYKIILVIICISIAIQISPKIPINFFESSIIASTAITILPLVVAISCFVISANYGGSKVFGKSYFVLGLSYIAFFIGEGLFYFYMDVYEDYSYKIIAEGAFMISMPLLLTHIIINIRYFVEKLEKYQIILLTVIPLVIVSGYSLAMLTNSAFTLDDYLFNLIFVIESAVVLGFTIVAFTIFRETALFAPWFLLLIGILFNTVGDIWYRYTDTISFYNFSDPATGLWLASSMMIIYALYKHQKSI